MPAQHAPAVSAAELEHRPVYSPLKRARRGLLRALGRWSRADYDIQFVLDGERIAYKKITFNHPHMAQRVADNLQRFGASEHLPQCRHTEGRALWIDFVDGRPCNRGEPPSVEQIARCFLEFGRRHSRRIAADDTGVPARHRDNLARLSDCGLLDEGRHAAIAAGSAACCPSELRVGFDYSDPIAANLVERADTGQLCAIDLKNWHADTLVGLGLAKTTDRWLDADNCRHVLDDMADGGLADVADGFAFIQRHERIERLRRRVDTELATHGRIRKRRAKLARLDALLD